MKSKTQRLARFAAASTSEKGASSYCLNCQVPSTTLSTAAPRVLEIMSRDGWPARELKGSASIYLHWLSEIIGDLEVDVIMDSMFISTMLWRWKPPGSTKSSTVHSTHVKAGQNLMTGPHNNNHDGTVDQRDD